MEGHLKFLGGGGSQKPEFYEGKPEFPGGMGVQNKNVPWGEYGYFLELHNVLLPRLNKGPPFSTMPLLGGEIFVTTLERSNESYREELC